MRSWSIDRAKTTLDTVTHCITFTVTTTKRVTRKTQLTKTIAPVEKILIERGSRRNGDWCRHRLPQAELERDQLLWALPSALHYMAWSVTCTQKILPVQPCLPIIHFLLKSLPLSLLLFLRSLLVDCEILDKILRNYCLSVHLQNVH